ncbi:polysaccharide biosynthesis/export family protein [Roseobacter sp. CCS2]|uniref:polysaccharide biosynthesis/export family protein n=1 Tax=Roseobacter sp. CCS2 TaxID=391593 RepID=UPI0000F4010B|nr:polysaccharide biosynthesis/export family protein [Roseobacter sp. CCS2]EBA13102.1 putative exopolysaccharide production protein [Roseobacter sp. CCS2]
MKFGFSYPWALSILLSAFVWLGAPASAQDNYPIGPGDVLEISFLSNPTFDRRVQVGIDGSVFLPLIGELNVRDQSINNLRERVADLMAGSVFREREGSEFVLVSVDSDEVILEVAEYRPIFVDGAVNSPGQQSFLVGMTARQAIAGARGLVNEMQVTPSQSEVRNHPRVLMADLVGVLAEMAVYEAILNNTGEIDFTEIERLNAPEQLINNAIGLARSQLATSSDILTEELSFLDTSVLEAEARIISALRHEESVTGIVETEEAEVTRIEGLVARRLASSELLTQTRRLYLQAIDRLGNVQADRLEAEADRRQLVLERNQAVRERALEIQARLQELSQQASQLRVRIELTSVGPVTLDGNETATVAPRIVIFRQIAGQAQEIDAQPETPLIPGDVVNVSLRN